MSKERRKRGPPQGLQRGHFTGFQPVGWGVKPHYVNVHGPAFMAFRTVFPSTSRSSTIFRPDAPASFIRLTICTWSSVRDRRLPMVFPRALAGQTLLGAPASRLPLLVGHPGRHADRLVADEGHGVVGLQLQEPRPPLGFVRGPDLHPPGLQGNDALEGAQPPLADPVDADHNQGAASRVPRCRGAASRFLTVSRCGPRVRHAPITLAGKTVTDESGAIPEQEQFDLVGRVGWIWRRPVRYRIRNDWLRRATCDAPVGGAALLVGAPGSNRFSGNNSCTTRHTLPPPVTTRRCKRWKR